MSRYPTRSPYFICSIIAVLSIGLLASSAMALINPKYTPVDMVRQAPHIIQLEISPLENDQTALKLRVVKAIKGKAPEGLKIDFSAADELIGKQLRSAIGKEPVMALMFAGDFGGATDGGADGDRPVGAISIGKSWFGLFAGEQGVYRLDADTLDLTAVWAGGTTRLEQVINYVLNDPRAVIPALVEATWDRDEQFAEAIEGTILGMQTVELKKDAPPAIFVQRAEGDLIFMHGNNTWADMTKPLKLTSKSTHAVWTDINIDGRLDLIYIHENKIHASFQEANQTFEDRGEAGVEFEGKLVGITSFAPRPGKLHSLVLPRAEHGPVVATFPGGPADGDPSTISLGLGDLKFDKPMEGGQIVAADFTGNGEVDLIQITAHGLILYAGDGSRMYGEADFEKGIENATVIEKGDLAVRFAAPKLVSPAPTGTGFTSLLPADFDADGHLDLLVTHQAGYTLFMNDGKGNFKNETEESGEPSYIARPGIVAGVTTDLNSDGREDFIFTYKNSGSHFFFNRGFRTFGYAIAMELADLGLDGSEALMDGQKAITVADFDRDGMQDAAFITAENEGWILYNKNTERTGMGLTVALPDGLNTPVLVSAMDGRRPLGARLVRPGRPAYFGKVDRGPLTLTWRIPGSEPQTQRVIVVKPTRFVLPIAAE